MYIATGYYMHKDYIQLKQINETITLYSSLLEEHYGSYTFRLKVGKDGMYNKNYNKCISVKIELKKEKGGNFEHYLHGFSYKYDKYYNGSVIFLNLSATEYGINFEALHNINLMKRIVKHINRILNNKTMYKYKTNRLIGIRKYLV